MLAECGDIEFLDGLKQDNIMAFNAIYRRYSKLLYVYLLDKLGDSELCNDILQDIFVNIWEKRHKLNIETSLKAYLFQAARYNIVDVYRKEVKYQRYLAELAGQIIVDDSGIIDRIDQKKKLSDIEEAVNNLPERMREIFILSRFKHQTTSAIASKTNLSRQTVKNQISKALRLLRTNYTNIDLLFIFLSAVFFRK